MDMMAALRQMQDMKKNYERTQEELEQMTLTGAAAGGMVTADVSGLGQIKQIGRASCRERV